MNPEIRDALQCCPNLPSPPGIAMRIVELGRDPDVDITALLRLLSRDPALASRVLRASNSALYAQRRRSTNLRQALVVIGLNATMTLALSFSLAETLAGHSNAVQIMRFVWRRALISASAAQLLGKRQRQADLEELFLAALLQDLGILALDAALPELYEPVIAEAENHEDLLRREREVLGCDHGEAGSWLMAHWGLPERLTLSARAVHDPEAVTVPPDMRTFLNCVLLGGQIADVFIGEEGQPGIERIVKQAEELLGMDHETLENVLNEVAEMLPEVATLYDTELVSPRKAAGVLDQARDLLAERNLHLIQQVAAEQTKLREMERTTQHLRETASRDPLTGLHNRRFFDDMLEGEFELATDKGWPLSIGFIDLDHFKRINDTRGHQVGDSVLAGVAKTLARHLRQNDFIMRYGGEEFVALLPGTGIGAARAVFERLREAVAADTHESPGDEGFQVTVSIGVATHNDAGNKAATAMDLVRLADKALYAAKNAGRNRVCIHAKADC